MNLNNAIVSNGFVITLTILLATLFIRLIITTHYFSSLVLQINKKIRYGQTASVFFAFLTFDIPLESLGVAVPCQGDELVQQGLKSPDCRPFHLANQGL